MLMVGLEFFISYKFKEILTYVNDSLTTLSFVVYVLVNHIYIMNTLIHLYYFIPLPSFFLIR